MTAVSSPLANQEFERFVRFLTVGALGTFLDFSLLALLKSAGLATLPANSLSFLAGLTNNFVLNRRWTFRDSIDLDWKKQLAAFFMISLAGLILNNLILLALEQGLEYLFGQPGWGYLPAKAAATGVVVFWNYFANRFWTFK